MNKIYDYPTHYDVIVVGGGHAGCEAALACAKMGHQTLLCTISLDHIALLPCNPSIGGPAKAHLVRELDAMGGSMGEVADECLIQMRVLNTSKGPAVHSMRAQMDKELYRQTMTKRLEHTDNLTVKQLIAEELLIEDGAVCGVMDHTGIAYYGKRVILCTGTYLKSRIIIGEYSENAGPQGQLPANKLSESLREVALTWCASKPAHRRVWMCAVWIFQRWKNNQATPTTSISLSGMTAILKTAWIKSVAT